MLYTKVHVSKLSSEMKWFADIFSVVDNSGYVLIAETDKGNPKKAKTIYDTAHNPINENTPLPIALPE